LEYSAGADRLAKSNKGQYNSSDMLDIIHQNHNIIHRKRKVRDICSGADPFVFKKNNLWHLLLQEDLRPDPEAHRGIGGYTLRTARSLEGIKNANPEPLIVANQDDHLRQVWAAEIHSNFLYVAASEGGNRTHRMHVYQTDESPLGPWKYLGKLKTADGEDFWAIDLTIIKINGNSYGVWSGWKANDDEFPQHIYISEMLSETEIGPRHLLSSPKDNWCTSVKPILEGPQAIDIDGKFYGLTITGNASWTKDYSTSVMKYLGGDPLQKSSWAFVCQPLFESGFGIGHGIIVQEKKQLYYIGHRKSSDQPGWGDRVIFYASLSKEKLIDYLAS